ncbi:MAG: hypothetical protein ABH827_06140, partial [bacterium]
MKPLVFQTYEEQIAAHLNHLQTQSLDVDELIIGNEKSPIIACYERDPIKYNTKKYSYKTQATEMPGGCIGLKTWFKGKNSDRKGETFISNSPKQGAALKPITDVTMFDTQINSTESKESAKTLMTYRSIARQALEIWTNAKTGGISDYLLSQNVGAYGLRYDFSPEYGYAVIVPMYDTNGVLWNLQYITEEELPSGTHTLMLPGGRTNGLFYQFSKPKAGIAIGVAESYIAAAANYKLNKIP